MPNLFGSKRKPRAVRAFGGGDDDDQDDAPSTTESLNSEPVKEVPGTSDAAVAPLKFGKRPFKQSALRKSININDHTEVKDESSTAPTPPDSKPKPTLAVDNADGDDGPVVVRPALSRAGSTKTKKKRLSSRLSFGGDAAGANVGDTAGETLFETPKKNSLSARALENSSALRSRLPIGGGSRQSIAGENDDGPRYSKEFLDELANSTPNTPRDLSSLRIQDQDGPLGYDEAMELDMSELDGAVIVDEIGGLARHRPASTPSVLTETQIRERKERRARLAAEQEFMPLEGSDNDDEYISLASGRKKEKESRLVREDEDLGEGFDEYVEDGGLSLGKRAEREAARKRRAEMAELIDLAEDGGGDGLAGDGDEDDDSEAERRAAYEEAQTRAGMDGLNQKQHHHSGKHGPAADVVEIPRMKPLPDLAACLAQMQSVLLGMEGDVAAKKVQIAQLEGEKEEIVAREAEIQAILDKAGKDYQAKAGVSSAEVVQGSAANSPLRPVPPAERGLESFGTPTSNRMDVDVDEKVPDNV